ncbi:hypothetical protein D3C71_2136520 [compost metagenome]
MQRLHDFFSIVARHQEAEVIAAGTVADHTQVKRIQDAKHLFTHAAGLRELVADNGN